MLYNEVECQISACIFLGPKENRVTFSKANGNYGGKSNIQLHCDIKQDYNDIAQYLGAVMEIKQVGHPSYKPIVGVTTTGKLHWSTSLAWDKTYPNSGRPSYNYRMSRTGSKYLLYTILSMICMFSRGSLHAINTHYIHSVVVQYFVSGRVCCVNQYHYESR